MKSIPYQTVDNDESNEAKGPTIFQSVTSYYKAENSFEDVCKLIEDHIQPITDKSLIKVALTKYAVEWFDVNSDARRTEIVRAAALEILSLI